MFLEVYETREKRTIGKEEKKRSRTKEGFRLLLESLPLPADYGVTFPSLEQRPREFKGSSRSLTWNSVQREHGCTGRFE